MSRILIFGGAGFIGTNLVEKLQKEPSNQILVFDNLTLGNRLEMLSAKPNLVVADMTSDASVAEVLEKFKPDVIYHLAANSDISSSSENPIIDIDNTLMSTVVLSNALRQTTLNPAVIFASSSAVYGESPTSLSEKSRTSPISSYGWMKLASERLLEKLTNDGHVEKCLVVRFPNVTGSYQTHGVVHDLVKKLKSNNSELEILGNGSQSKPYALASELCQNFLKILNRNWSGFRVYNLAPMGETRVSEIVQLLLQHTKLEPKVKFGESDTGWPGDINRYTLDCSKAHNEFEELVFLESTEAIKRSITWAWANIE